MNNGIGIINFIKKITVTNIFLLLTAVGTFGQAVLVADSHTSATSANGNFGSSPTLTVSANSPAYMKFNFAAPLKAGNFNSALGWSANFGANNLTNATAIGTGSYVSFSNSIVLGGISEMNGGTNTNVGIGTIAPRAKLQVTNGKIYVEANGQGVVLKSPNGSCFELTVTNAGSFASTPVACP